METRIVVRVPELLEGALLERMVEIVREAVPETVYRPADSGEHPSLLVPVHAFREGATINTSWVRGGLTDALAGRLAETVAPVEVYRVEVVPGAERFSWEMTATKSLWEGPDNVQDIDLTAQAEVLADSVYDVNPAAGGNEMDHFALEIIEALIADFDAYAPAETVELGFVPRISSRLVRLVEALEAGADWEWCEIAGQRALKIVREEESQMSVLTEEEIKELEPWLSTE